MSNTPLCKTDNNHKTAAAAAHKVAGRSLLTRLYSYISSSKLTNYRMSTFIRVMYNNNNSNNENHNSITST